MGIEIKTVDGGTREVAYRDGVRLGTVICRGDLGDGEGIQKVRSTIQGIYDCAGQLSALFPALGFAPEGEMVENMGRALAAGRYGLVFYRPSAGACQAFAPDGRLVQVATTESIRLSVLREPEHLIVIKFFKNGVYEEVYNGATERVWEAAEARGRTVRRSIAVSALRDLSEQVSPDERIEVRVP